MKVRTHLANQSFRVIERVVLRRERLHRDVQALQLLDYVRRSNVSVMDDRSWVQRKDALGAQRAMIANGLDFLYIGRIGGRQIDADDVVLRAQRPNDLVVDRRDNDVSRVL